MSNQDNMANYSSTTGNQTCGSRVRCWVGHKTVQRHRRNAFRSDLGYHFVYLIESRSLWASSVHITTSCLVRRDKEASLA
jgi:hypothetical protein